LLSPLYRTYLRVYDWTIRGVVGIDVEYCPAADKQRKCASYLISNIDNITVSNTF